jgi:hypothetical protein
MNEHTVQVLTQDNLPEWCRGIAPTMIRQNQFGWEAVWYEQGVAARHHRATVPQQQVPELAGLPKTRSPGPDGRTS